MDMQNNRRATAEGFEDEALRDVLSIERQVQGIVNDAEQEAQRIIRSAQERARELKQQAETEAREQAAASLRESMARIEQEAGEHGRTAAETPVAFLQRHHIRVHFVKHTDYPVGIAHPVGADRFMNIVAGKGQLHGTMVPAAIPKSCRGRRQYSDPWSA